MPLGVSPQTHNDVYPAIEASKFVGALKGKVAFVTGAGKSSIYYFFSWCATEAIAQDAGLGRPLHFP